MAISRRPALVAALLCGALPSAAASTDGLLRDPAEIAAHVRAAAQPLDWAAVFGGTERLVYFGERHPDARPKAELVTHMKEIAAAGFTHLAIEMLGEDRSGLLERFGKREAAEDELARAFAADWGPEDRGFQPQAYAAVLAAAREAGLQVVALDLSIASKRTAWNACVATKKEDDCDDDETRSRDDHMMRTLAGLLGQKGTGRVLAWTGAWHACGLEQAAKLRAKGFPSRSYYLVTKGRYERDSGIIRYVDAVEDAGWSARRLLIPTRGVQACFDGLIYEPGADVASARRS